MKQGENLFRNREGSVYIMLALILTLIFFKGETIT